MLRVAWSKRSTQFRAAAITMAFVLACVLVVASHNTLVDIDRVESDLDDATKKIRDLSSTVDDQQTELDDLKRKILYLEAR
jgi:cell division protein FtsL